MRTVAPLPSGISAPLRSETRTFFLARESSLLVAARLAVRHRKASSWHWTRRSRRAVHCFEGWPLAQRLRLGQAGELLQGGLLDLADAFACDAQAEADLLERARLVAIEAEAQLDDDPLACGQRV